METTRNRAAVLAKILRAALAQLHRAEMLDHETDECANEKQNGWDVIDAVAEELETAAAAPDPEHRV
jgi:hypothetical protein